MAEIGTVTGIEILPNKDGTVARRMLQVRMSEDTDIQTIEQFCEFGNDSVPTIDLPEAVPPITGSKVIVIEIEPSWKIAIACDDNIVPEMLPGEKKLYSLDADGLIVAFMKFLLTGNIEINGTSVQIDGSTDIHLNGSADFAVAYTDLKTAFDQLKTDFDNLVTLYNAHIHITTATVGASATPGIIAPTVSTGSPTTADMAGAKVDTVKLP